MSDSLQQKTFSGVVWGFISNFSMQLFSFIQGIIMARILIPSDYGLIAMVGVFSAVAALLVDSGFASALIRKKDKTDIDYSTVFDINVIMSFIITLILCGVSGLIADFYNQPILSKIVCLNALQIFLGSFISVQGVRMSADLRFKEKNIAQIVVRVSTGLVGIAMALTGFGIWSLIYPSFLAIPINMAFYWHYQHWFPGIRFSVKSFKELFGFGSKLLASGLLDTIYNNIYPIIIGKLFSAKDLGYYTRATGYSNLPSTTVTGILASVAFPVLCDIQGDSERLQGAYRRLLRLSAFVVFPIMIGLAAMARPLILVMITAKWEPSVVYLQILCFALMWYPIHALNLNLLQVKGRSDLFLRLEIIKKIIGVSIIFIASSFGVLAMCIGSVISSLLCLFLNTYYTGKFINLSFWYQMKDLIPSLFYSLSMGGLVWGISLLIPYNGIKLLVCIPLGIVYYFLIAYLTKSSDLAYMKIIITNNVINRFKKTR